METSGILLLADISGYTKFLTRTAIEHATWIVTNLFSSMLDVKLKELEVLEIEGDAIFCWLPSDFRRKDWTVVNDLISRQHRRFVATQNWFLNVDKCEIGSGGGGGRRNRQTILGALPCSYFSSSETNNCGCLSRKWVSRSPVWNFG